jgi:hypothetical protein
MEQNNQQIIQKPPFPIKTKIAAWWIIVISGAIIYLGFFLVHYFGGDPAGTMMAFLFCIYFCLIGLLIFFLPGIFLLKRKKLGWYWAIIALLIVIASFIYDKSMFNIPNPSNSPYSLNEIIFSPFYFTERFIGDVFSLFIIFISCLPFFLLLLDRKNFWKIAS